MAHAREEEEEGQNGNNETQSHWCVEPRSLVDIRLACDIIMGVLTR